MTLEFITTFSFHKWFPIFILKHHTLKKKQKLFFFKLFFKKKVLSFFSLELQISCTYRNSFVCLFLRGMKRRDSNIPSSILWILFSLKITNQWWSPAIFVMKTQDLGALRVSSCCWTVLVNRSLYVPWLYVLSLTGLSSVSKAALLMMCTSCLHMAWPCPLTLGIFTARLFLEFARLHMSSFLFCYKPQITSQITESTRSLDIMDRTIYRAHKVISFSAPHLQLETFHNI